MFRAISNLVNEIVPYEGQHGAPWNLEALPGSWPR